MEAIDSHPVVFYNVENLFDTENDPQNPGDDEFLPFAEKQWDEERYAKKLSDLSESFFLINNKTPLFFGLAEVENKTVMYDLIQQEKFRTTPYKIVHFDSEDRRGIDCGFVYDSAKCTLLSQEQIRIRIPTEEDFRTRSIIHVLIAFSGNRKLHVFINHWPSRGEGTEESTPRRLATAAILRQNIEEILSKEEDANILLMGDFNDTPSDLSIRDILRAKGQHEQETKDLISLLASAQNKGKGTINHRGDWEVFDQLIVSQGLIYAKSGLEIMENKASILKDESLLYTYKNGDQKPVATYGGDLYYGGASDHLPVYLFLKFCAL